jgi:hypothetical protein
MTLGIQVWTQFTFDFGFSQPTGPGSLNVAPADFSLGGARISCPGVMLSGAPIQVV